MKIIASDFDGTFVRSESVNPVDIDAVKRWQAAGNLFGFNSGRCCADMVATAHRYLEGQAAPDFYVCGGGSVVCDKEGKIIWDVRFDSSAMKEVRDLAAEYGMPRCVAFFGNERYPMIVKREVQPFPEDVAEYNHVSTSSKDKDFSKGFANALMEKLGDKINAQVNGLSVDIVAHGVTKSTGLYEVMKVFGVAKEDVITIGDNHNDYDMVKDFNGCAVHRATPRLKEIARRIYNDFGELVDEHL